MNPLSKENQNSPLQMELKDEILRIKFDIYSRLSMELHNLFFLHCNNSGKNPFKISINGSGFKYTLGNGNSLIGTKDSIRFTRNNGTGFSKSVDGETKIYNDSNSLTHEDVEAFQILLERLKAEVSKNDLNPEGKKILTTIDEALMEAELREIKFVEDKLHDIFRSDRVISDQLSYVNNDIYQKNYGKNESITLKMANGSITMRGDAYFYRVYNMPHTNRFFEFVTNKNGEEKILHPTHGAEYIEAMVTFLELYDKIFREKHVGVENKVAQILDQ